MKNKMTAFIHYTSALLKETYLYRIAEVKTTSMGAKVVVQVIGKATFFECMPHDLMADDKLVNGFAPKEVRLLTYLACEQAKQPRYRITTQAFDDNNHLLFTIKPTLAGGELVKTARQILLDKALLDSLGRDDVRNISYIAGYEHADDHCKPRDSDFVSK